MHTQNRAHALPAVPADLLGAVAAAAGTQDIEAFSEILAKTIMPSERVRPEQITSFLMVASQYKLNPVTKEIYAFPNRGGIQPIVSIDGWLKIINSHPQFDGMEFKDELDGDGKLLSVTCRIYRKDRSHPIEMTEYMRECSRGTDPWKQWPNRMLRHKATIQAARYAFGFSGICDPDEAERIEQAQVVQVSEVLADEAAIGQMRELIPQAGRSEEKVCRAYGCQKLEDLSAEQAKEATGYLRKAIAKAKPQTADTSAVQAVQPQPLAVGEEVAI